MLDLGLSAESNSQALAINNRGQVLLADDSGPYLWQNGTYTKLSLLPTALNNKGQVAGTVFDESDAEGFSPYHASLWQNGTLTMLGELPGDGLSTVIDVNDAGEVIGVSYASSDHNAVHPRGFIWRNGVMTDLGTLGGSEVYTFPTAINDRGQVVGESVAGATIFERHAFLWQKGEMTDLGTLPGHNFSSPLGINARGQIVGFSGRYDTFVVFHAVLWDFQGTDDGVR